ncbi:ATP-binding protein [Streptomyces phytophilus]|uniref:ATP-binding protein n=1 Tax=Streptomyces phytophilus TaxID=722715 RepID=UPI0015F0A762|nr:ATP-binding protein [Streptomyces phytophilus]
MAFPGRASNPPGEYPPYKRRFARRARSVSRAREFVVGVLGAGVCGEVAEDIRLCVSELASNALRHTPPGREFLVCVLPRHGVLRIEVHDAGTGVPYLCAPTATDDRGRGLLLVGSLADDWGVSDRAGPGKAVWAEFKAEGEPR